VVTPPQRPPNVSPTPQEPSAEERILRATTAALAELDPGAVTIKRLCAAAGVTAPTLYYHFGSKDGLLAAAVERLVEEWLVAIDAAVDRGAPLAATVDQAVEAWVAATTAPSRPIAVFTWATLLLAGSSDQARDALVRVRDRALGMVAEVVALHVGPAHAGAVASLVGDVVVASAIQYELDHDEPALRQRLAGLGVVVAALAGAAAPGPGGG
jgi:AcrR family transcriptional regulator